MKTLPCVLFLSLLGFTVRAEPPVATHPATTQANTAMVPVPKLENDTYDWYARHEAILELKKTMKPEVVMIGDSITHFWAGEPTDKRQNGPKTWTELFGDRPVLNLGYGFDRTQNVLWRLDHGEFDGLHPKYVVVHIGTNNFTATKNFPKANTPTEVAEAIEEICRRIRTASPESKLILMAVMPRGQRPDNPYRAKIAKLNEQLAVYAKEQGIAFVDIGPKLLEPDGTISRQTMSDFVHPTEKGYAIWAEALRKEMQ
jgi:lysophospholipase L1-like esterase